MADPLISVIIPVYNTEAYLGRCLTSVINNTYKNLEILCINDGSPDNSLEILNRYAAMDSRIRVISQENGGLSAARNTGIENATGDYLYYLDSDDWIHKNAFEFLMRAAEETGADVIIGGYKSVSSACPDAKLDYPPAINTLTKEAAANKSGYLRSMVWGTLYRASCVDTLRFPVGKVYAEDVYYNTMLISTARQVTFTRVDIPLYYYFSVREGSIMNTISADALLANIKWWLERVDSFEKTDYVLSYIFSCIFSYRYQGSFYANPDISESNARKCIHACMLHMKQNSTMPMKLRAKNYFITFAAPIYKILLIRRDPSYREWERIAKAKYANINLKAWEEV